jgi:tetratricopeptide (TPR) repeat protein
VELDHRQLGVDLYNDAWRLLEKERTPEEDDELLHQAHASAYHWLRAPECEPKNRARSEWLCSHVYSVLGRAEPALQHAERCRTIVEADPDDMDEFDLPFAYEALARAHLVGGDETEAERYERLAREAGTAMTDTGDLEHFEEALSTLR